MAAPVIPPEPSAAMRARALAVAALAVLGVVAYANSFAVPFLFDDWVTIQNNPRLRQLWPIWAAFSPPEETGVGGRPVANLSFVLNYALTGESVRGFHAGNLAIHLAAALALFGLVRRTLAGAGSRTVLQGMETFAAFVVAAGWMVHPLLTQSVTYISQRTESVMGLFYLLTLYCFRQGIDHPERARLWHGLALASCAAGMGSKEGMVTAPLVVFLYDYAFVTRSFAATWRQRWRLYSGLAASWVLLALLMRGLPGRGVGFGHGMSAWAYLLLQAQAISTYLARAVWPTPLVFDYGMDLGTPGARGMLLLVGWAAAGAAVVRLLVKAPGAGFLGAWFLLTLAPTSSVVPIPLQPISENRMYLPLAGVVVALVLVAARYGGRRALLAMVVAHAAFAVAALARNHDYRSEVAIWNDTVAKRPGSARAHNNLGYVLMKAGRLPEAKQRIEEALRIRPQYAEALVNLASVSGMMGDAEAARRHARRAAELEPENFQTWYHLGVASVQKGDVAEGAVAYERAVRLRPDSLPARGNLALALLQLGRTSEAMVQAEAVLALQPGHRDATYVVACGLLQGGKAAEAVPLFEGLVRNDPGFVDAQQNLGLALMQLRRFGEALGPFELVVRLVPNHASARFGAGTALLNLDRAAEAVPQLESALQLAPSSPEIHLNLGLALARTGRAEEALARLDAAVKAFPNVSELQNARGQLRAATPSGLPRKQE